jgi:hypothetical protein
MVYVFANVPTLAATLFQSGLILRTEVFHEFVNGFNSAGELVTFVDVGRGKELADSKINGTRSLYLCSFRFDKDVCCYATMSKYNIGWKS